MNQSIAALLAPGIGPTRLARFSLPSEEARLQQPEGVRDVDGDPRTRFQGRESAVPGGDSQEEACGLEVSLTCSLFVCITPADAFLPPID